MQSFGSENRVADSRNHELIEFYAHTNSFICNGLVEVTLSFLRLCLQYGRFGSLLSYVEKDGDPSSKGEGKAYVARQLCQHIIGMNPQRVGDLV